jgi:hypothetical protein
VDVILVFVLAIVPGLSPQLSDDRLALEEFLRTAEIVDTESIPVGVTRPVKVELSDGEVTRSASWKTVDERRRGITRLADGTTDVNFRDSYAFEIAAYELDKLIETNLVPPTVERRWRREVGALQLWIEDATTDFDRREKNLPIPDVEAWNRQVYNIKLFRCLTYDIDYKNARNTLIDPDWKLWAIDSSRSFRMKEELVDDSLSHFSRAVLAKLRELHFEVMKERLGDWLSDGQIRAILARRDRILERADQLIAERGEPAVLVP